MDAIELGTRLFFDTRLSSNGKMACGSCHVPERNWTDNLTRGMGKVLASFQETLVSGGTSFDKFRDGLAKGTDPDKLLYSDPAKRGLRLFIGKGACTTCHSGPNFTAGEFFNTGLSTFAPTASGS